MVFQRNGPTGQSMYTTTSFSIKVNRIVGEPFKPKRCIRWGDSISPYFHTWYLGRFINFMTKMFRNLETTLKFQKMAQ